MSKLNTSEFAKAIGKKIGTIRAHISRGKLQRDEDGYIDTEIEKNRQYIHDQTKGKGLYTALPATEETQKASASEKKESKKVTKPKDTRTLEQKKRDKEVLSMELRKKRAELQKAEYDAELKRIEIEKKAGKLMPIELVQRILTINIQSIFRTFEGESENVAGIFSEVLGGSRKELAEIIKRMRESLADAIEKAKEDSAAEISQAIDDYAETRSRGERK